MYLHCTNLKNNPANELERVKLRKTNFFYEQEKVPKNIRFNTPEMFDDTEMHTDQPMNYALCYDETNLNEDKKETVSLSSKKVVSNPEETIDTEKQKHKGAFSKESVRNKKELFTNPSRSFKEIFNFFKDRDKKRNNIDNSKTSVIDGSKLLKSSETRERKVVSHTSSDQIEKDTKSNTDLQCLQQTPLMFSRHGSLNSLTGFEQSFVQDDRSSNVSDFSCRASGGIPLCELPDSSDQLTAPKLQQKSPISFFREKKIQLPQHEKAKISQCSVVTNENCFIRDESSCKKLLPTKYSVFEDDVTIFKDESTPTKLHSMTASSLSSLTIDDDDDDYELINKIVLNKKNQNVTEDMTVQNCRQEPIGESTSLDDSSVLSENTSNEQNDNLNREVDDELCDLTSYEEKLLDEYIRLGIAKWTKRNINEIKPFSWDLGLTCQATRAILRSHFRNNPFVDIQNNITKSNKGQNEFIVNNNNSEFVNNQKNCNSFRNNSDNEINLNESETNVNEFNSSCYVTNEEDDLLDQCIRRGMAKITKKHMSIIKPFSSNVNNICLTTRAMILRGQNEGFYSFY